MFLVNGIREYGDDYLLSVIPNDSDSMYGIIFSIFKDITYNNVLTRRLSFSHITQNDRYRIVTLKLVYDSKFVLFITTNHSMESRLSVYIMSDSIVIRDSNNILREPFTFMFEDKTDFADFVATVTIELLNGSTDIVSAMVKCNKATVFEYLTTLKSLGRVSNVKWR